MKAPAVIGACVVAVGLLGGVARGQEPSAQQLFDEAQRLFDQGEIARSITRLEQAREAAPSSLLLARILLYLGLNQASDGRRAAARASFVGALELDPELRLDPARVKPAFVELFDGVRAELAAEQQTVAVAAAPPPEPTTRPARMHRPTSRPAPQPAPRAAKPRRRVWTWIAAGSAVAAAGVAVGLWFWARADRDEACELLAGSGDCATRQALREASADRRYRELYGAVDGKRLATWITGGAAAGLAVTAIVLYWIEGRGARDQTSSTPSVTVGPRAGSGWGVSLTLQR